MKANTTYVDVDEFLKVARESGCQTELQAGFHKVTKEGAKAILYVAKTKSCGRVDVSQCTCTDRPHALRKSDDEKLDESIELVDLGGRSFGKVHQQLHFGRSRDQILETFRFLCTNLDKLQPLPAKERQRPVALKGSQQKKSDGEGKTVEVVSEKTPKQLLEEMVKRKQLLLDSAAKNNAKVSEATMEKINGKIAELEAIVAKQEQPAEQAQS